MVEEPGGSSTETAFCLLYIGLNLYMVLTVVALSMVLTGNVAKRRWGRMPRLHLADIRSAFSRSGKDRLAQASGSSEASVSNGVQDVR